jgi:hypothetical protein
VLVAWAASVAAVFPIGVLSGSLAAQVAAMVDRVI